MCVHVHVYEKKKFMNFETFLESHHLFKHFKWIVSCTTCAAHTVNSPEDERDAAKWEWEQLKTHPMNYEQKKKFQKLKVENDFQIDVIKCSTP